MLATESSVGAIIIVTSWKLGFFPDISSPSAVTVSITFAWILMLLCFCSMTLALMSRRKRDEDLLILGTDDLARAVCRRLDDGGMIGQPAVTIDCAELNALSLSRRTTRIVVADSDPMDRHELATALIDCKLRGVAVENADSFHERVTGKLWVKRLDSDWWIYSNGFQPSRVYQWRKRLLDIVCASLMILLTAPLLVLIAIGIKLESAGPAIFSQERIGLHGEKFTLYKFRSMNMNAESESGPAWAAEFDNRVTPFGKLLRKFRILRRHVARAHSVLRLEALR
jgi:hypothetical protein